MDFENILFGDSLLPVRIFLIACLNSVPLKCEARDQEQEVGLWRHGKGAGYQHGHTYWNSRICRSESVALKYVNRPQSRYTIEIAGETPEK
jgi:hypothetical protein